MNFSLNTSKRRKVFHSSSNKIKTQSGVLQKAAPITMLKSQILKIFPSRSASADNLAGSSSSLESCSTGSEKSATFGEKFVDESVLMIPLLKRFREKLSFVMFPIPARVGFIPFLLKKIDTDTYRLFLCGTEISILETSKNKSLMNSELDIKFSGEIQTKVGRIVKSRGISKVKARTFKCGLDKEKNAKGNIVINAPDLSDASLNEICTVRDSHVQLDSVLEVDDWDGMQSITGFYGRKRSWPYKKSSGKFEHVHSSLFNASGRSLDFLGATTPSVDCKLVSEGNEIAVKNEKSSAEYLQIRRRNEFEAEVRVSFPLSPVQAFGLMVTLLR